MIDPQLFLNDFSYWVIIKWFYVTGFGLYLLFSLVVWRQIHLMGKTLNGSMYLPIRMIGVSLVAIAVLALVLALMVL